MAVYSLFVAKCGAAMLHLRAALAMQQPLHGPTTRAGVRHAWPGNTQGNTPYVAHGALPE